MRAGLKSHLLIVAARDLQSCFIAGANANYSRQSAGGEEKQNTFVYTRAEAINILCSKIAPPKRHTHAKTLCSEPGIVGAHVQGINSYSAKLL